MSATLPEGSCCQVTFSVISAGDLSRNRTVGLRLGRGEKLSGIIGSMHGAVAEGVLTSKSAHNLAMKLGVECPIIEGIYRVIHGERGRRACCCCCCYQQRNQQTMTKTVCLSPDTANKQ